MSAYSEDPGGKLSGPQRGGCPRRRAWGHDRHRGHHWSVDMQAQTPATPGARPRDASLTPHNAGRAEVDRAILIRPLGRIDIWAEVCFTGSSHDLRRIVQSSPQTTRPVARLIVAGTT